MIRTPQRFLLVLAILLGMPAAALAESGDDLYYQIGGAAPVSVSAGRGYQPGQIGLGLRWNANTTCGRFDPQVTVRNQLNGWTDGFKNMMGDIVEQARGAVAQLPAMIIQRARPGLYDLLSNGILQGKADFNKAKLSCQKMAEKMAEQIPSRGWQQQAIAQNWRDTARGTQDAVKAERQVEQEQGNDGQSWVGGDKRGGSGQPPIRVVRDTTVAGYNGGTTPPAPSRSPAAAVAGGPSPATTAIGLAAARPAAAPAGARLVGAACARYGSRLTMPRPGLRMSSARRHAGRAITARKCAPKPVPG